MTKMFQLAAGAVVAIGLAFGVNAADAVKYTAALSTGEEVPPVTGAGKGTAEFTLDPATKEISWTVTFDGLSGPAIAGHIHGPADRGANAGVVVNLGTQGQPLTSPATGKATLTDAQIAELNAGKYYVNVHTMANKAGEIRGQIGK